jgi:hypothetical protein
MAGTRRENGAEMAQHLPAILGYTASGKTHKMAR